VSGGQYRARAQVPHKHIQPQPHSNAHRPSAESRGSRRRAPPLGRTRAGGAEARSSSQHARQQKALYHRQLAIHTRKAGRTLGSFLGESSVDGFTGELNSSGAKARQCLKRGRSNRVGTAVLCPELVSTLVCLAIIAPKSILCFSSFKRYSQGFKNIVSLNPKLNAAGLLH
jgi:hypothetical protein